MSNDQSSDLSSLGPVLIVGPMPPPYGGMSLQAQVLCDRLREENITVILHATNPRLPKLLVRVKGLRTLLRSSIFFYRLIRQLPRAHVVHILAASYLYFFLCVAPTVFLARLFGKRVILNYRGGAASKFLGRWGFAARPVLRRANVIMVPSRFLERVFAEHGFTARIIPNLVETSRFAGISKHEAATADRLAPGPWLLVMRNLEPTYNVKMALQAFEKIKERRPNARIDVLGTGEEESRLRGWVSEHGLRDVYFHGAIPNENIPLFLGRADILLNPSDVDNMPINLLEAFAAGVPVVSTRVGGIPDLVGDEQAALLVEPGDYLQMAEKVEDLLANPEKVARLAKYARELCKRFTWEAVKVPLLKVYYPENALAVSLHRHSTGSSRL